jgi:aminopeptidase N
MMYRILLALSLASFLLASCSTTRKSEIVDVELRELDTIFVEAAMPNNLKSADDFRLPVYRPSASRQFDLLHTRLDIRFNWEEEQVIGQASLQLTPYFYPNHSLTLDAKQLDIEAIRMQGKPLTYDYDDEQLYIQLPRLVERGDTFEIEINYTAQPAASGGSSAITSNQGLFFINPQGTEGNKPQQIWTQGETEWNSRWFPTIDKPNERCTQEVYLTVEDRFQTLSNGVLKDSRENADGTRTDYWHMDQPHAPYLFALVVGDFAVVREEVDGLPLSYYVEPKYEKDAKAIFARTPEMIRFFSQKLDYPFPWDKYAQVVVRDYVSGAMENTTASIFGEFVQKRTRALINNHNDGIVAHELFHQWFGNLVTCESWANLTMNEGFANYSEYLWFEHYYGPDEAAYHLLSERSGYFFSARGNAHPLIHFGYDDKEDMFDAHSYNKGGAVLHMLHRYVGDAAFWAALNRYLTENAYTAVEAHDLRLAFESVTGEDLNWFFNQWYFSEGHPEIEVEYAYNAETKEVIVKVEQQQDPERSPPIFILPTAIDIHYEGKTERKYIRVDRRQQEFIFPCPVKPDWIQFDPEYILLAEYEDNKDKETFRYQLEHGVHFRDRYDAIQELLREPSTDIMALGVQALEDSHWYIREMTLNNLPIDISASVKNKALDLVKTDPDARVRAAALAVLAPTKDPALVDLAIRIIESDSAYSVVGRAVELLNKLNPEKAQQYVQQLENTDSEAILISIAQIYAESGDPGFLSFFERNLEQVDNYAASSFYNQLLELALQAPQSETMRLMNRLKKIGLDQQQSPWRRLAAAKTITDLANEWQSQANRMEGSKKAELNKQVDLLMQHFEQIKTAEENDQLRSLYRQLVVIQRN